jgi:hypothetical protein
MTDLIRGFVDRFGRSNAEGMRVLVEVFPGLAELASSCLGKHRTAPSKPGQWSSVVPHLVVFHPFCSV